MKIVKVIRPVSLDIYKITANKPIMTPGVHGCLGCLAKIGLLLFPSALFILGVIFLCTGIAPDNGSGIDWCLTLVGLFIAVGCLIWLRWILKGGKYRPGKSFYWWRLSKERMQLWYKVITVIIVIISIPILIVQFKWSVLLSLIGCLIVFYFMMKSFKVHGDVDYVANQELSDCLGMEIDEKIQASYLKKNVVMLLTDKKIICSYFEDNQWKILNKRLDEIVKIGVYTPVMMGSLYNTDIYFLLLFTDSTRMELKMELEEKITSNPDLFFRKFLVTIDAVLLGKVDEKKQSRRRVSINKVVVPERKPIESQTKGRRIDISNKVIPHIQSAKPVEPGRLLEL